MMWHPFDSLDVGSAVMLLVGLAAATATAQRFFPGPLRVRGVRWGIVSLEVAADAARADEIVRAWRDRRRLAIARRNVWWDFVFIPLYATLGVVAAVLAARLAVEVEWLEPARGADLGAGFAYLAWAAGAFDVLENVALLQVLPATHPGTVATRGPSGAWTLTAALFAFTKFALLAAILLFVVVLLAGSAVAGVW